MLNPRRAITFIRGASRSKVWIAATAVAGAAITFIAHYISTAPTRRSLVHTAMVQWRYDTDQLRAADAIPSTVIEHSKRMTQALATCLRLFNPSDAKPSAERDITNALDNVMRARRGLATAVGQIEGARFSNTRLEMRRAQVREYLAANDVILFDLERLYHAVSSEDDVLIKEAMADFDLDMKGYLRNAEAMNAALVGFREATLEAYQNQVVVGVNAVDESRVIRLQYGVSILAGLYLLGYCVCVAREIFRVRALPAR